MKNEKVAEGRIVGLAGPCSFTAGSAYNLAYTCFSLDFGGFLLGRYALDFLCHPLFPEIVKIAIEVMRQFAAKSQLIII